MIKQYTFRAFVPADLPMVAAWLSTPEVARWYPDPDYIEDLEDHLEDSRIRMQLVCFNGAPFAYIQDYDIHGWPNHHLAYLPPGSRGLDTFIGRSDMVGRGHGTAYLTLVCDQLLADEAPALGIDPDPHNQRAIAAYLKVGFTVDEIVESEWGRVLNLSRMG